MKGARISIGRALAVALALTSLVALGMPSLVDAAVSSTPPNQLNARVSMTIDAGLNSYVKEHAWIPLRITLVNTGDPIEGEVEVIDKRLDIAQRFAQPVSLARGVRRQVMLYVPSATESTQVHLVANGAVVASVVPIVHQLTPNDRLVIVASDPPDAFNFIGDVKTASGSTSFLALLRLDQLPDRTAALDAADAIVLNGVDTSAMTRAQRDAVIEWVAAGGHLILSGGPTAQLALSGFADVAPARIGQALVGTLAGELATLAGPIALLTGDALTSTTAVTLTVPRLQPALPNVRTLAGSSETPLIVRRDMGRGIIDQLAFDPALAPLRDWPGRAAMFATLLNGRVNQANDIGTVTDGQDAAYAAGALAAASPPSALVVGGFFALYVVIIGPLNFLALRRFRRQAWAWLTIPAIVLGFTLLGLLTGFRLRGNNPQMHRLSVTLGDAASDKARTYSIYGLYSPRRADVDIDTSRALVQIFGGPPAPEQTQPVVTIAMGDPTHLRNMPLGNTNVRTVYAQDGGTLGRMHSALSFVPGSANTAAAISGEVRNDTNAPLLGCSLVAGKDYQAIGDLDIGKAAQVKLNLVMGHPQSLVNLRDIGNTHDRAGSGRGGYSYSATARSSRPTSSSASGSASSGSSDHYPFEQTGPPVGDALVGWQKFSDALLQDAEFGTVVAVFGAESIGTGVYVGCWGLHDTSGASIANADYTDRALRIWRVPVQGHLTGAGESLPPDVFSWSVLGTTSSSELSDNGLSLEPGSHIIALTPWFDLRIGTQTPLIALNLSFNTSNSSAAALQQTSISIYNWHDRNYVKAVDAADNIATQNTIAGPFISPAGQIILRIDSASESITLDRITTTVEMGK